MEENTMRKSVKIISALLVAVMLVIAIAPCALATVDTGIITDIDTKGKGRAEGSEGVITIAGNVVKWIRTLAAIAAVVIISILGIKYMIGSTEERAEYKKSFMPLIIGIVVVVAAAQIATMIFGALK
jgi:type IV secretory pathway VirB2 component (pilin)